MKTTRTICCIFCLAVYFCTSITNGWAQTVTKGSCLTCHGPYDKLTSAKPKYTTEEKETVNPHVYDPHDKKDAKNIPECTNCHKLHPMDTQSAAMKDVPKPDVKWCYGCHHTHNLTSCKTCHQGSE